MLMKSKYSFNIFSNNEIMIFIYYCFSADNITKKETDYMKFIKMFIYFDKFLL